MSRITRRQFVHGSAAAAAAASLPSFRPARLERRSPSEEIRVAVAGLNGRGQSHVSGFQKLPNVRVVALCDVDERVLAARVKDFDSKYGERPDVAKDLRTLLERADIDVIAIATPNHQHSLQTVWACQAGKDVYCEKPVSHNVWEGGQAVKAAHKYERIVQTGTQSRSSQAIAEAIEWIREGHLGAIELARGMCYKPRQSIGKVTKPTPIPVEVDYDLYCGPAPLGPLMRRRLHYDWHWQFATGNGDLGNQGIHQMDMCRWAIGADHLPPAAMSLGGRFGYDDDGDTANTQLAWYAYDPAPILFEVRGLPRDEAAQKQNWGRSMDRYEGIGIGCVILCEGGRLSLPNYNSAKAFDGDGKEVKSWSGARDHFANFIDAVRSRKPEELSSDIREGHLSSALCHMGNDSYKLGEARDVGEIGRDIGEGEFGRDAFERFASHLEANGVDLEKNPPSVGPWVVMNPETERYNDDEVLPMLARDYRAPFVVPKEV